MSARARGAEGGVVGGVGYDVLVGVLKLRAHSHDCFLWLGVVIERGIFEVEGMGEAGVSWGWFGIAQVGVSVWCRGIST